MSLIWSSVESVLTEMCAELQEHSDVPLTVDSAIDAAYENWRVNELLDSRWLQESDVEDLATSAFYRWGGRR